MFNFISKYLRYRKMKSRLKQYRNGYDFAAGQLLRNEITVRALENYYFDDYTDQFDLGTRDAVTKLKDIGFINE